MVGMKAQDHIDYIYICVLKKNTAVFFRCVRMCVVCEGKVCKLRGCASVSSSAFFNVL